METRDILDYLGQVIGQMTLPEGTPEETWAEKLGPYALAPTTPTLTEIIAGKIQTAQDFGAQVVFNAKVGNVAQGITQAGKTKEVSDFLSDVARYLNEGSLYAAIVALDAMISGTIPDELSPFVTVARMTATKNLIQDFLQIPRT